MSNARWDRIQDLYHAALERPASARAAFLNEACAGDAALLHEVQSLLDQPVSAEQFLVSGEPGGDDDTPSLRVGQRLGVYQVQALIGRGGMGEVYRAHDAKLGRDVAIKILPQAFTSDKERLARFEREARVLASLNHPHVAVIHGLEESEGFRGLVLELVEGETLAERIALGPIPIKDALRMARQIADALDGAHEKGIVHRDLKPANLRIAPDGTVKVLDFGLAKLQIAVVGTDPTEQPAVTIAGTREGMFLGTAAYMSPEQARGQPVDKRTDIWAFGCVLYEMLTGRRAFAGETVSDTIAALLDREPDWKLLPASTPAAIQRMLERCLQKDPRLRLHDIADARIEIDDAINNPDTVLPATVSRSRFRRVAPWMAVISIGSAIAVFAVLSLTRRTPDVVQVQRLSITLPASALQPANMSQGTHLALSRDGKSLVYVAEAGGRPMLYLRRLAEREAHPLPGTEKATRPFFSPDGESVGFVASGKLMKVSLHGGEPVAIATADNMGAWVSDDRIIFGKTPESGGPYRLFSVPAAGGVPQQLPSRIDDPAYFGVSALPGGKAVVFGIGDKVAVLTLDTGKIKIVADSASFARYVSSGHLVYLQRSNDVQSTVMAMPFDLARLEPTGPPVPVVHGVIQPLFTVSESGLLMYAGEQGDASLVWVDRSGHATQAIEGKADYFEPRLSPDGQRVAIGLGTVGDVWILDLGRGSRILLTHGDRAEGSVLTNPVAVWTPDGKHLTFSRSLPTGEVRLEQISADGTGQSETLYSLRNRLVQPGSWSESGALLAFHVIGQGTGRDLMVWRADARRAEPFLTTRFNEAAPRFSLDAHWIAYVSNSSGRDEVYLLRYPEATDLLPVSIAGGREPVWSRNGRELFYRDGRRMMSVSVDLKSSIPILGHATELFQGDYRRDESAAGVPDYDVAADGRFLMLQPSTAEIEGSVVVNWSEELKRLVPVKK